MKKVEKLIWIIALIAIIVLIGVVGFGYYKKLTSLHLKLKIQL